eukprot:gene2916-5728_t
MIVSEIGSMPKNSISDKLQSHLSYMFITLFILHFVSGSTASISDLDIFGFSFGTLSMETHFPNGDNFISSLPQENTTIGSTNESTTYLSCCKFNEGYHFSKVLQDRYGNTNVYPFYVDKTTSLSCFRVNPAPNTSYISSNNFPQLGDVEHLMPIPLSLLLDPMLVTLHSAVCRGTNLDELTELNVSLSSTRSDVDISVVFGLGVRAWGIHNLSMTDAAQNLRKELLFNSRVHLQTMVDSSESGSLSGNMWSAALITLSTMFPSSVDLATVCGFYTLSITPLGKSAVHISNLQHMIRVSSRRNVRGECLATLLAVAVSIPQTGYVYLRTRPRTMNFYGAQITQTGSRTGGTPYHDRGLNGSGQILGSCDTGVDMSSCFFSDEVNNPPPFINVALNPTTFAVDLSRRKVIQYLYSSSSASSDTLDYVSGHGTHTTGTLVGYPRTGSTDYKGIAYGAKLQFYDSSGVSGNLAVPLLSNLFRWAFGAGVRVHSNSWGSKSSGGLSDYAVDSDTFMYDHPTFLAVFAAGNFGSATTTIVNPALAKSCMTVGAVMTSDPTTVAHFSSRGPTGDGRIGIDVLAPGRSISSAKASGTVGVKTCSTVGMAGTSMATPTVAGSAALIRQYFMQKMFWASNCNPQYKKCRSSFEPLASTVKAILINSAVSATYMTNVGPIVQNPDISQGFGVVDLMNVLPMTGVTEGLDLFVDEIVFQSGMTMVWKVVIPSSSAIPLKATISWTDLPSIVGTGKQLINDIDITIVASDGKIFYGNNGINKDSLNPVERIFIANPSVGTTYTVTVSAAVGAIPSVPGQTVSLVVTSNGNVTPVPQTSSPSKKPSLKPISSKNPSKKPASKPSKIPTRSPSIMPSTEPTTEPTADIMTSEPSTEPTTEPTADIMTSEPSTEPTTEPTDFTKITAILTMYPSSQRHSHSRLRRHYPHNHRTVPLDTFEWLPTGLVAGICFLP